MTTDPTTLRYAVVDVFTDRPLAGNPLAVVVDADHLHDPTMHLIAREFNLSETTFTLSPTTDDAAVRLRSFTASGEEVFGAGHNALGAWWYLVTDGRVPAQDGITEMNQQIGNSVLPVLVSREDQELVSIAMRQQPPRFLSTLADRDAIADALELAPSDLVATPGQVVDTGAAHLLVAAVGQRAVDRAMPKTDDLATLLRQGDAQGCYLFTLNTSDQTATAYARFFNPGIGIWEDPATGSAAGPLACWLVDQNVVEHGTDIHIHQGHHIGRPSQITAVVDREGVLIAGTAVVVAEGQLRLPPAGIDARGHSGPRSLANESPL